MTMMNDATRPTAVLKAEHQVILRTLDVLRILVNRSLGGEGFELEACKQCVEFFQQFADACHHAKEEDLLFPKLQERGVPNENGPIGMMLHEHQLARGLTRDMDEALNAYEQNESEDADRFDQAAGQYIELLGNHIYKEDNILFAMGEQVMSEQDQQSLCDQFCEVGCRSFGGKKLEQLEQIADDLEKKWKG